MAEFNDQPNIRHLKQCYYELLNLEMDASEEEIRSAYKYQALRWHPDKNRSDPETAATMFKEVQQAYAVLSDPRKRVWYDKFRDKILQGNEDLVDDQSLDLEEFMVSSCYTGFGDDESDFYTVYRDVFDQIMREELPYEDEDDVTPPGFGTSTSSYEDVHKFYAHWSAFCTKKTFDHLMKYDVLEAPNRRTLRAMEKENVKIRELAKRERNDGVRALVAFVKKRDKRVHKRKHELNAIIEINRQKTQDQRRRHLESRRQNMEQEDGRQESEWTSMKSLERSLAALERRYDREHAAMAENGDKSKKNGDAASDDGEEDDILILSDEEDFEPNGDTTDKKEEEPDAGNNMFCVACDKCFKSRPAFENHSRSKKHIQNVEALKKALLEDESLLS